MKGEGTSIRYVASGGQTVDSQSGSDWAYLTGSDQDDELIASVAQTTFRAGNVQISLQGVDRIYSQAGRGGLDVARFEPSNAATDSLLISGRICCVARPGPLSPGLRISNDRHSSRDRPANHNGRQRFTSRSARQQLYGA